MRIAKHARVRRHNGVFPLIPEHTVDVILIIGILLLVLALLGFGGVIGALADIAWVFLIIAVIVIAWRIISGRRAV
ncbi:hypothetical protein BH23GEM8_BH23GEM8_07930 [soil metagenome]